MPSWDTRYWLELEPPASGDAPRDADAPEDAWPRLRQAILRREPDAITAALWLLARLGEEPASELAADALDRAVMRLDAAADARRFALVPIDRTAATSTPIEVATNLADLSTNRPAAPPPADDDDEATTWFEVLLLDDLGDPVAGIDVEFVTANIQTMVTTDGDGRARLEGALGQHASARATLPQVRDVLHPRWEQAREGTRPAGDDHVEVLVRSPLDAVALAAQRPATVVLLPHIVRIRLTGMYFENAKAFLLPDGMRGMTKLHEIYAQIPDANVLIVGHTNTVGAPDYNDALSLERAAAIAAFLVDDVDAWLAWYGDDRSWEKRWGAAEDRHMLGALPHGADTPYLEGGTYASLRRFQAANGLPETGTADAATRRALVTEYMAHDRTTLPAGASATTHGCGESFPEVEPGASEHNRRVEIFVFDGPITPPPQGEMSGPDATDYPAWRAQTVRTYDVASGATTVVTSSIWIRLELSADDAAQSSETLVLTATDGYEQRRTLAEDHVAATDVIDAVDVEFTDAPVDGVFTLRIVAPEGDYELFAGVPFIQLGALGLTGPSSTDDPDDHDDGAAGHEIAGIVQPTDPSAVA